MLQLLKVLVLLVFAALARSQSGTAGDYCFASNVGINGPLNTKYGFAPMAPNAMGVLFLLFDKDNLATPKQFTYLSTSQDWQPHLIFDTTSRTRFIVHGWSENYPGNSAGFNWMEQMKNKILSINTNDNVIAVNWSIPANSALYYQSAANTQTVGKMIACVINRLKEIALDPNKVHLIGHSLGGQVVGFAGKGVTDPKCGQITADDPASPGFQENIDLYKLAATDGQCVNVIHTNGALLVPLLTGFGTGPPCGTFDFYPNGGHSQPGCGISGAIDTAKKNLSATDISASTFCSHHRSNSYALADLNFTDTDPSKCQVIGHTCSSYDDFKAGKCGPCSTGVNGCKPMPLNLAYWDVPSNCDSSATIVVLYLKTGDGEKPDEFCLFHYQIIVSINPVLTPLIDLVQCLGAVTITINGKAIEVPLSLTNQLQPINGNKRYTKLYTNTQQLGIDGVITSATITPNLGPNCPVNKIEINYMTHLEASVRATLSKSLCPSTGNTFIAC